MPNQSFMPCFGIDNTSEDAAMVQGGREPFVYVRDANNVNVTPAGKIEMVASGGMVTDSKFQSMWQSPLHKDIFAILGNEWVKVNTSDWSYNTLADIGSSDLYHTVLNNLVVVAGKHGIYTYDGQTCQRLTIDAPPPPFLATLIADHTRTRSIAISWLRGSMESSLSSYVSMGADGDIALPMVTDPTVTDINIYATNVGGTDMQLAGTVNRDATSFTITNDHKLGMAAQFAHLSPMPTGKFLCYWNGRIITATANVIRFSEPLAYHLHDERHGFIQTSQRVTFLQPVSGGLWVGQTDHVIFIQGSTPDDMVIIHKNTAAPIPGSAIQIDAAQIGEIAEGGDKAVVWLSAKGYVAGNSGGQLVEYQAKRINNISAASGTTVRLARRLLTAVN